MRLKASLVWLFKEQVKDRRTDLGCHALGAIKGHKGWAEEIAVVVCDGGTERGEVTHGHRNSLIPRKITHTL